MGELEVHGSLLSVVDVRVYAHQLVDHKEPYIQKYIDPELDM